MLRHKQCGEVYHIEICFVPKLQIPVSTQRCYLLCVAVVLGTRVREPSQVEMLIRQGRKTFISRTLRRCSLRDSNGGRSSKCPHTPSSLLMPHNFTVESREPIAKVRNVVSIKCIRTGYKQLFVDKFCIEDPILCVWSIATTYFTLYLMAT